MSCSLLIVFGIRRIQCGVRAKRPQNGGFPTRNPPEISVSYAFPVRFPGIKNRPLSKIRPPNAVSFFDKSLTVSVPSGHIPPSGYAVIDAGDAENPAGYSLLCRKNAPELHIWVLYHILPRFARVCRDFCGNFGRIWDKAAARRRVGEETMAHPKRAVPLRTGGAP